MPINYYEILGVEKNAGLRDIKKAYHKLALRYHPDRNPGLPGADQKFIEISTAYQILSDPVERARYDKSLEEGSLEQFMEYWEDLQAKRRPPPPPAYYRRRFTHVVYSRKTKFMGALIVLAIVFVAISIPLLLLRTASRQNYLEARILYGRKLYFEALQKYDRSITEMGWKNPEACAFAGYILTWNLKNPAEAIKYLKKGLRYHPNDSVASVIHYLMGINYIKMNNKKAAYGELSKVYPNSNFADSAAYRSGLILCLEQQDYRASLKIFRNLLYKNKNFDDARYFKAYCLQKTGYHREAIEELNYLLKRNYEPGAVYYHRARSEIKLKQTEAACLDLKKAMEFGVEEARELYVLHCNDNRPPEQP